MATLVGKPAPKFKSASIVKGALPRSGKALAVAACQPISEARSASRPSAGSLADAPNPRTSQAWLAGWWQ